MISYFRPPLNADRLKGSMTLLLMSLTHEIGTNSWTVWAHSVMRNWCTSGRLVASS